PGRSFDKGRSCQRYFPHPTRHATGLILKSRRLEGILQAIPAPQRPVRPPESRACGTRLLWVHRAIRLSSVRHAGWAALGLISRKKSASALAEPAPRFVPTTALRAPENYGLRGWIWTRSSDLAPAVLR